MSQTVYNDIRPSPIAGQWYPGQRDRLAESIDSYLDARPPAEIPGRVIGLMAPHAGHLYSGRIAADAFRLVRGRDFRRVVIVSPMHQFMAQAVLTSGHEAYATPLGVVGVDRDTLEAIGKRVRLARVRRDPEHALEIELPFLQRALGGDFLLTPIMVRDQSYAMAQKLGDAIAETVSAQDTLLVASSDLSHFYTEQQAHALDKIMLGHVEGFDPEGVIRADDEGQAFACGRAAVAAVLVAARGLGADRVTVVGYGTSAEASGDYSRVVGYGAAAISKT